MVVSAYNSGLGSFTYQATISSKMLSKSQRDVMNSCFVVIIAISSFIIITPKQGGWLSFHRDRCASVAYEPLEVSDRLT